MVYSNAASKQPLRVLLVSVRPDAHECDTLCVKSFIEQLGHVVINLGSCVSDELIIDAASNHPTDLIAVSGVSRHGFDEGLRLIKTIRSGSKTAHVPVVIGWKFGNDSDDEASRVVWLRRAGYDAVFDAGSDLAQLRKFLFALRLSTRQCSVVAAPA